MARPRPVLNERALLIESKDGNVLVVADFHIGIEYEFLGRGVRVPSQTGAMLERLNWLLSVTDSRKLVVLGDVKHQVPGTSYQELRELPGFLEGAKCDSVEIVAGNHDTELECMAPKKVVIHPSSGMVLEKEPKKFGLFHGHAWPARQLLGCDYLVCAHLHPVISITDPLGGRHREPCWLFSRMKQKETIANYGMAGNQDATVIIMPAFNPILGGLAINEAASFGSFFGCVDFPDGDVFLLDGTGLGKLKDI